MIIFRREAPPPRLHNIYYGGIGSFDPDAPILRAQIAAMMTRIVDSVLRKLIQKTMTS